MKKIGLSLTGVGVAMAFAFAAQSAQASSMQCPGQGEGGVYQNELPGEGCTPQETYGTFSTTAYSADNVALEVDGTIVNGDDLLTPGDIIEVEIDLDDVMAHLKANQQEALMLAADAGIRPGYNVFKNGTPVSAKLSDIEVRAVAKYVLVNIQSGTARGQSDPAGSNTSRAVATAQAIGRAIGSTIRSAFNFRVGFTRVTERQPNGAVRYQTEITISINEPD